MECYTEYEVLETSQVRIVFPCKTPNVMLNPIDILGLVAGMLTTIAFMPQVWKCWKSRSVEDLSTSMYLIILTGVILWLTYGLIKNDIPIIAANGVTLFLVIAILGMMVRFRMKPNKR